MDETLPAPRRRPRFSPLVWPVVRALGVAFAYGPLRMRRLGPRRVPATGATLVVCNHVAFIDAVRPPWSPGHLGR